MEIKRYTGIRNTTSEERFRTGDLMSATNVELDNTGKILSRRGTDLVLPLAGAHSLYCDGSVMLVSQGSNLYSVDAAYNATLVGNLQSSAWVSHETVGNTVFMSNGQVSRKLENGALYGWGITTPVGQPEAVPTASGTLPPGVYQYAMTFVRADGQESGTGVAGQVTLTVAGGIQFNSMEISTEAGIRGKILYLSGADGEVMFRAAEVANDVISVHVSDPDKGAVLTTQHAGPAPAGSIVRYHRGHMFVVAGDTVYRSDPYQLELFRVAHEYVQFPGQIALFEPVRDGVFVATVDSSGPDEQASGATWYVGGALDGQVMQVFDYGAIPGTGYQVNSGDLESPNEGEVEGQQGGKAVLWATRNGLCMGVDGGSARNLTHAKYSLPTAQRGASFVRKDRGYPLFVSSLQGTGAAEGIYSRG